jgi:translation initiation factor 2 alpha subunit (eIF-2alpha)
MSELMANQAAPGNGLKLLEDSAAILQPHSSSAGPYPAATTAPAAGNPNVSEVRLREEPGPESAQQENKVKERIRIMTEKTKAPGSDVFERALKNYEQTLRTGVKLQEEASQWWTNLLKQSASAPDWQKKVSAATNEFITPAQKRMEEYLGLLEQNNKTNVDLLKKGLEAAQTAAPAEAQAKWVEFWENSLRSLQSNAQGVTQINSKMMESWLSFVKKNVVEPCEPAAAKA